MNLYLSSYKLGDKKDELFNLTPNGSIALVPNAQDFTGVDLSRRKASELEAMDYLEKLGFKVELLDLRDYFGQHEKLETKLREIGAVFVRGGNVFVLRQAMKLSGMDTILKKLQKDSSDFLYAGYSAGGCVLAPSLDPYKIVDDSTDTPYALIDKPIWDGLGILDYIFLPHWDSDHPESEGVSNTIDYCEENDINFKAIRDGEVIILQNI